MDSPGLCPSHSSGPGPGGRPQPGSDPSAAQRWRAGLRAAPTSPPPSGCRNKHSIRTQTHLSSPVPTHAHLSPPILTCPHPSSPVPTCPLRAAHLSVERGQTYRSLTDPLLGSRVKLCSSCSSGDAAGTLTMQRCRSSGTQVKG